MSKLLSECIEGWIGNRPDEWILKEWQRKALTLEAENAELREELNELKARIDGGISGNAFIAFDRVNVRPTGKHNCTIILDKDIAL